MSDFHVDSNVDQAQAAESGRENPRLLAAPNIDQEHEEGDGRDRCMESLGFSLLVGAITLRKPKLTFD